MSTVLSHLGVWFMRAIAGLPLPWVRAMGWALGWALYALVPSRRHVARVNQMLYFSQHQNEEMRGHLSRVFIYFAQAWLDRSWLWHSSPQTLKKRVRIQATPLSLALLRGQEPLVLFAPHFVGLDAGWTALTCPELLGSNKAFSTIYTDQSNRIVDAWIAKGRSRFAPGGLHPRAAGVQGVLGSLKAGGALYLLPDMDFGEEGAVFVPLFGKPAATVTSLSRFAKLSRAKVLTVTSALTPSGYSVRISEPWQNYPTKDLTADTARMNAELEALIAQNPDQYWWLHKRFKTRPPGEAELY
jgi:Kdo2-lipid IVA lauroyltransferase/acyltransferase